MASYKLEFKKSVSKDLRSIPPHAIRRILRPVENLRIQPRPPGCSQLSGQPFFRIRIGVYRVLYSITEETLTVLVIRIAHRKKIYRGL